MATKLYFRSRLNPQWLWFSLNHNNTKAAGGASAWSPHTLATTQGDSSDSVSIETVAGPTDGIEFDDSTAIPIEWFTDPLAADVTISGTMTFNLWAQEGVMTANIGLQVIVERVDSVGTLSTIVNSEQGVELGTSIALENWTAAPTSTAMKRGDRLRARILINDAGGTMASGSLGTLNISGNEAQGADSWIELAETLTFENDPTGTILYLTNTASDVSTADVDREAWTTRGGSSLTDVTNTAAGWTSPLQVTDTAGGTAVSWFTKQLAAFTLGGKTKVNIWAAESNSVANAAVRAQIAICDADGSNAVVWATAGVPTELSTVSVAEQAYPAGPDTLVSAGQRLRIRLFVDDRNTAPLASGQTVTTTYNGPTIDADGDTWLQLQQTVTEFVPEVTEVQVVTNRGSRWITS